MVMLEIEPEYRLYLEDPGPNRLLVIVRVRELLGVSPREAKEMVDCGEPVFLAEGMRLQVERIRREFENLGARTRIA